MDNASDKKPLLSSKSSHESVEGSASNKDSKETKSESKKETKPESKKEPIKETPPVSGGAPSKESAPNRVVRPTVQARPFSTKTKKAYWVFTIIHLILLLALLFSISFGLLQFVFSQTTNGPLYWGTGSFIGGVPSIMFEPTSKGNKKREIQFNCSSKSSYMKYVDRLIEVTNRTEDIVEQSRCLNNIENNVWIGTRTNEFCTQRVNATFPDDVCNSKSNPSMGYDQATPCLLIRLTKLLGFFPTSDAQHSDSEESRPSNTDDSCAEMVKFNCTAKHFGDTEEEITILVPDGIPFCHFPYWNQKGYTPPYIMIRPQSPLPKGKTVITCSPALKSLKKLSNGRANKVEIIVLSEEEAEPIPSIMYEPMQRGDNEIKFNVDSNSSFKPYVDRLREVVKREIETNAERARLDKCDRRKTDDDFDSDWSGNKTDKFCNQKEKDALPMILAVNSTDNATIRDNTCNYMHAGFMGYSDGTPCLLIGLTKVVGFFPMSDEELETGIRHTKRDNACKALLRFNCTANHKGANNLPDKEIEFIVPDGIPYCHFPFWNQKGYIAPYLMIRPKDPLPKGKTVITCFPALKSLKKLSKGQDNIIEIVVNREN
ncbi:nkb-2 [Pristionchus pacificus]|nr:nkb-2 [Pristionchus pacificus]